MKHLVRETSPARRTARDVQSTPIGTKPTVDYGPITVSAGLASRQITPESPAMSADSSKIRLGEGAVVAGSGVRTMSTLPDPPASRD